jgi:hypothetical protein
MTVASLRATDIENLSPKDRISVNFAMMCDGRIFMVADEIVTLTGLTIGEASSEVVHYYARRYQNNCQ